MTRENMEAEEAMEFKDTYIKFAQYLLSEECPIKVIGFGFYFGLLTHTVKDKEKIMEFLNNTPEEIRKFYNLDTMLEDEDDIDPAVSGGQFAFAMDEVLGNIMEDHFRKLHTAMCEEIRDRIDKGTIDNSNDKGYN